MNLQVESPVNVLIIDDSELDRRLCRSLLERQGPGGFLVYDARDGQSGVETCREHRIDCILLDYVLPGSCGLDWIAPLRKALGDPFAPVIMLTGAGDEAIAADAILRGASDYIPKTRLNHSSLDRAITNARQKAALESQVAAERAKQAALHSQLVEKNEQLQALYQTVSHELKTPLCAAREFVSLMADGVCGPVTEQQAEFLDLTQQCCDTLTFLLNNWLDTVRSETGKLELHKEVVALAKLVGTCGTTYSVLASKEELELRCDIDDVLPPVAIDAPRIEQTIANLLSNAIKFTDPGGRITLSCHADEDFVCIGVEDDGRGVPQDKQAKIFEAFGQADVEDTSVKQGMGLGLHVCKTIVELHGGRVTLESQPGHGSHFKVWLPIDSQAVENKEVI